MRELINTLVNVFLARYINVPSSERFAFVVLTVDTFPREGYTGRACEIRTIMSRLGRAMQNSMHESNYDIRTSQSMLKQYDAARITWVNFWLKINVFAIGCGKSWLEVG